MNSIKDILVIGGGLGGLMTGAILSKVGFKVTVLEKNHTVGGGLQCFQRYGKIFETGMHIMGGMLPGENVYRLCSWLGITDKLKIRLTDAECMDFLWFYEEGKKYSLPSGRKAFYDYLAGLFPDSSNDLQAYMNALWSMAAEVDIYNLRPEKDGFLREHCEDFLMPVDKFIAKYIRNRDLSVLLAYMNPLYGGIAGHTPAFVHSLINVSYINGTSMFVDGSQQMADALMESIINAGGKVCAGETVKEINVEDKEIRSVVSDNGNRFKADMYISAIHPCSLLDLLPPGTFQKAYCKRLQSIPNSYSAFSVYIGLKDGTAIPFVNHTRYFMQSSDVMWKLYDYNEEEFPSGFLCITPPSSKIGKYADRITVTCPMPFSAVAKWADSRTGHRPVEYKEWKARMLSRVLDKLELMIPGVRNDAEFIIASSPLTIRDYYAVKEGSMYGYMYDCTDMALSYIPMATKLRNLLLTGQNVFLHGMCGVSLTAIKTAECLTGRGSIVSRIP